MCLAYFEMLGNVINSHCVGFVLFEKVINIRMDALLPVSIFSGAFDMSAIIIDLLLHVFIQVKTI